MFIREEGWFSYILQAHFFSLFIFFIKKTRIRSFLLMANAPQHNPWAFCGHPPPKHSVTSPISCFFLKSLISGLVYSFRKFLGIFHKHYLFKITKVTIKLLKFLKKTSFRSLFSGQLILQFHFSSVKINSRLSC